MKYTSTLLAFHDIEQSKKFYQDVLGLKVVADFGSNVVLTGGIALQTLKSWAGFLHKEETEIVFAHHAGELYFKEDDIKAFMKQLEKFAIKYVHPLFEHRWGQRVVRFYDPEPASE